MYRFNPTGLINADLIVGIPSERETKTLPNIITQISKGLRDHFPDFISTIVKIESPSQNGRPNLQIADGVPVITIFKPVLAGRGQAIYFLLEEMVRLNARAAVVIDPSHSSITPEWIRDLAAPILYGYDFVAPLYSSSDGDENLGSHICYPLIYGLLGKRIRYPLGGEIAISSELAQYYLSLNWSDAAQKDGVDIFMTLHALLGKFECCQTALGPKYKKYFVTNLTRFSQVVSVLFEELLAHKERWLLPVDVNDFRMFGESPSENFVSALHVNGRAETALREFRRSRPFLKTALSPALMSALYEMYDRRSVAIDSQMWMQILYEIFYHYEKAEMKDELIKGLESLYSGRLMTLLKESAGVEGVLEKLIKKQAECFYKFRTLLTQKYEYELAAA